MGVGPYNQNQLGGIGPLNPWQSLLMRRQPPPAPPPNLFGSNITANPRIDFNQLPRTQIPQAEPYQRPTPETPPFPTYTPQFNVEAIMQAIQARQAQTPLQQGMDTALSGLPALRAAVGGEYSAG